MKFRIILITIPIQGIAALKKSIYISLIIHLSFLLSYLSLFLKPFSIQSPFSDGFFYFLSLSTSSFLHSQGYWSIPIPLFTLPHASIVSFRVFLLYSVIKSLHSSIHSFNGLFNLSDNLLFSATSLVPLFNISLVYFYLSILCPFFGSFLVFRLLSPTSVSLVPLFRSVFPWSVPVSLSIPSSLPFLGSFRVFLLLAALCPVLFLCYVFIRSIPIPLFTSLCHPFLGSFCVFLFSIFLF